MMFSLQTTSIKIKFDLYYKCSLQPMCIVPLAIVWEPVTTTHIAVILLIRNPVTYFTGRAVNIIVTIS